MKMIITIDTEEDNWGDFSVRNPSLENLRYIPALQELFDEFNVLPTYLLSYPVATDEKCIAMLRGIHDKGRCEIGTHCHPWNTPPFEEDANPKNSMLCNLSSDLQFKKLSHLHKSIKNNYNITPTSFRAGRWGFSNEVAHCLRRLGYTVDTSIQPTVDWGKQYGPDYSRAQPYPYYFEPEDIYHCTWSGSMLEVPATVGFLRGGYRFPNAVFNILKKYPFNRLHLLGFLSKLQAVKKVLLSPENSTSSEMIDFTTKLIYRQVPMINLWFHSTSLKPGLTSFVKTEGDQRKFMEKIKTFLIFAQKKGIESITLSASRKVALPPWIMKESLR